MKLSKLFMYSFFLLATSSAMSQTNLPTDQGKNEIYGGAGIFSVPELGDVFGNAISLIIPGTKIGNSNATGAISLGYRFHINRKWAFGISGVFENINDTYIMPPEKYSYRIITAMADVHYYYIHKRAFQLYSGVYAGVADWKTSGSINDHSDQFAFQVTPLGFRVGKTIGVFGEAGFGYRGVFAAGISARF